MRAAIISFTVAVCSGTIREGHPPAQSQGSLSGAERAAVWRALSSRARESAAGLRRAARGRGTVGVTNEGDAMRSRIKMVRVVPKVPARATDQMHRDVRSSRETHGRSGISTLGAQVRGWLCCHRRPAFPAVNAGRTRTRGVRRTAQDSENRAVTIPTGHLENCAELDTRRWRAQTVVEP